MVVVDGARGARRTGSRGDFAAPESPSVRWSLGSDALYVAHGGVLDAVGAADETTGGGEGGTDEEVDGRRTTAARTDGAEGTPANYDAAGDNGDGGGSDGDDDGIWEYADRIETLVVVLTSLAGLGLNRLWGSGNG